jgi:catechol 2,3-dioxygenase-like lactoylglutathione lyase family enzyme
MLTAILAVTLSVPDLLAVEQAYSQWLGYRVVERGLVSSEVAAGWNAPLAEGRRFVVMQPSSGEPTYLRLVQSPETPGYAVMKTHGWNSNEILVEDPDALAEKLAAGSPFRIVGPPRPLGGSPTIRAMQVIGPAGELNYFTRIPADGSAKVVKTPARSFVDRTFIVVLGGPSMAELRRFYAQSFGLQVTEPSDARINVLQDAWGQGRDFVTPLALVIITPGFLIELDEYPRAAIPRPSRAGDLPPGMAIVTFAAQSLDRSGAAPLPWLAAPRAHSGLPYSGRRAALLEGAAGELIEIVETG